MGEELEVEVSFSDAQCDRAALLSVNGYNEEAIALACRVSVAEVRLLLNEDRVRGAASGFAEEEFGKEIDLNSRWDELETEALEQLRAELEVGESGLELSEKLAVARVANSASRRNKIGGIGKHGVIDPGNGGGDVITLNMPTVVIDRLQKLTGVGGDKIIDGEFEEVEEVENSIAKDVTTGDIEKFLGVDVKDGGASAGSKKGLNNTDGKLETVLQSVAQAGVGVSDEFG